MRANQAVWSSVVPGLVFNPDTGICGYWIELKSNGQYIGAPITEEISNDDGTIDMAFTSGAVIHWDPNVGPSLV